MCAGMVRETGHAAEQFLRSVASGQADTMAERDQQAAAALQRVNTTPDWQTDCRSPPSCALHSVIALCTWTLLLALCALPANLCTLHSALFTLCSGPALCLCTLSLHSALCLYTVSSALCTLPLQCALCICNLAPLHCLVYVES